MCYILALETSCDDTAASVVKNGKILTNIVSSQKIHQKFGGVVPELASRQHQKNLVYVVEAALKDAHVDKKQLNALAFTSGPGLIGSLLVAVSFAKGLSLSLDIPLIEVDHLHAHVMANFIDEPKPDFPFLCLLVSGGHTQILKVISPLEYEILGSTIDDAAGEAFDKAAKVLDLPYPGGPVIDKLAQNGNPERFSFPWPKIQKYNYSFSGLKTSFLYFIRDELKKDSNFLKNNLEDLCASYQHTIAGYLLSKVVEAARNEGIKNIALAGGVAANSALRKQLMEMAQKHQWSVFYPKMEYCMDNAAMIAITAWYKYQMGEFSHHRTRAYARKN